VRLLSGTDPRARQHEDKLARPATVRFDLHQNRQAAPAAPLAFGSHRALVADECSGISAIAEAKH